VGVIANGVRKVLQISEVNTAFESEKFPPLGMRRYIMGLPKNRN